MNRLDLHGVRHFEVQDKVENFLYSRNLPVIIITGGSRQMRELVIEVLEENEFHYSVGDEFNTGYITVLDQK